MCSRLNLTIRAMLECARNESVLLIRPERTSRADRCFYARSFADGNGIGGPVCVVRVHCTIKTRLGGAALQNLQQLLLSGLRTAELTSAADRAAPAAAMMNPPWFRGLPAD